MNEYELSQFGKEIVEALPDRAKVERVKAKWKRRAALAKGKGRE